MRELYDIIKSYFYNTSVTGYLPLKESKKVIILDFINDIITDPDYLLVTDKQQETNVFNLYIYLLKNNNL
jgi:hypothetical protein